MSTCSQCSANAVLTSLFAARSTAVRPCWSSRNESAPRSSSFTTVLASPWALATGNGERPERPSRLLRSTPASRRTWIRSGLPQFAAYQLPNPLSSPNPSDRLHPPRVFKKTATPAPPQQSQHPLPTPSASRPLALPVRFPLNTLFISHCLNRRGAALRQSLCGRLPQRFLLWNLPRRAEGVILEYKFVLD
jgi:hypothetical protein